MTFEYIFFLLITILPVFYKLTFWLYLIQLKEYRIDRFREYIWTPQWKRALLNFWFFIELPLFIWSFSLLLDKNFEIIVFPIVFYFLVFYNIFVLGKIFRKRLLTPKKTSRLLLLTALSLLAVIGWFYCILSSEFSYLIYIYVLALLLCFPLIIFAAIFVSQPLTLYKKNKLIDSAVLKSEKINEVIKVWITGSYGKSSVKEFLASVLEQDWELLKTPENINTELWISDIILRKSNNSYKY